MKRLLFIGCGLLLATAGCATAQEQTNQSNVASPRADSVLRSACDFLAQTPAFSLSAEIFRRAVSGMTAKH